MYAYIANAPSPAGPLSFAVDDAGALVGLQFSEGHYARTLEEELARGGYTPAHDPARTAIVDQQLAEYAAGTRLNFDLPFALRGTAWQIAIWQALTQIPFGTTRTYAQLAAEVGRPTAARAAGRANATNRIPLVIPCHRVIGASGALTGFAGGTHLKERLLAHESSILANHTISGATR